MSTTAMRGVLNSRHNRHQRNYAVVHLVNNSIPDPKVRSTGRLLRLLKLHLRSASRQMNSGVGSPGNRWRRPTVRTPDADCAMHRTRHVWNGQDVEIQRGHRRPRIRGQANRLLAVREHCTLLSQVPRNRGTGAASRIRSPRWIFLNLSHTRRTFTCTWLFQQ